MIQNKLRAGYPGLYLVTHEEQRAEAMILATVQELHDKHGQDWHLYAWTCTAGRFSADGTETSEEDPRQVLDAVAGLPEQSILILKDYHIFLSPDTATYPLPELYRAFKDALFDAEKHNKTIIILSPVLKLPPELEKLICVIEFALPDKEQIAEVLTNICVNNNLPVPEGIAFDNAVGAARGLTTNEAKDAFSLAIIESGSIDPKVIGREKANTIAKNGILEIIHPKETLDSIGGLDLLRGWLHTRRRSFSAAAAAYQLDAPKGILIAGIPGTGKSLTAKVTSLIFGVPLLKLDAGSLFASHVGESEGNLRLVIAVAEAIAPCVLWIDELEKGFNKNSGGTDGGTADRVYGNFLNWLSEKKEAVFVVATANDVTKLDSALVRKGRFDEIFWVDLPDLSERTAIWKIQIAKRGRKPESYNLPKLAALTEGCTGSEIECLFIDAMNIAFAADREPTLADIEAALKELVPLSKMMADDIKKMQDWAKGRARKASLTAPTPLQLNGSASKGRKIAA
jgi:SpoVK/Ycf46/Vps4 family AAA+-type ATPase